MTITKEKANDIKIKTKEPGRSLALLFGYVLVTPSGT